MQARTPVRRRIGQPDARKLCNALPRGLRHVVVLLACLLLAPAAAAAAEKPTPTPSAKELWQTYPLHATPERTATPRKPSASTSEVRRVSSPAAASDADGSPVLPLLAGLVLAIGAGALLWTFRRGRRRAPGPEEVVAKPAEDGKPVASKPSAAGLAALRPVGAAQLGSPSEPAKPAAPRRAAVSSSVSSGRTAPEVVASRSATWARADADLTAWEQRDREHAVMGPAAVGAAASSAAASTAASGPVASGHDGGERAPVERAAQQSDTRPAGSVNAQLFTSAGEPPAAEPPAPPAESPPAPPSSVAPPDPRHAWTAEVQWDESGGRFAVLARTGNAPEGTVIAGSDPLEWPPASPAAVQALSDAVGELERELLDAGWTSLPTADGWYAKRFAWNPVAAMASPDPAESEEPPARGAATGTPREEPSALAPTARAKPPTSPRPRPPALTTEQERTGRFQRRPAWPEGSEDLWRCELRWDAGVVNSRFEAVAYEPGARRGRPVGASAAFKWLMMADPDPSARTYRAEVRALAATLQAAGWERVGRGAKWYSERFIWRRPGSPPDELEQAAPGTRAAP